MGSGCDTRRITHLRERQREALEEDRVEVLLNDLRLRLDARRAARERDERVGRARLLAAEQVAVHDRQPAAAHDRHLGSADDDDAHSVDTGAPTATQHGRCCPSGGATGAREEKKTRRSP